MEAARTMAVRAQSSNQMMRQHEGDCARAGEGEWRAGEATRQPDSERGNRIVREAIEQSGRVREAIEQSGR
eukprot:1694844-Prymnesium_polylepis.1